MIRAKLVNIGNTHSEWALWDGECIGAKKRLQTKEILAGALLHELEETDPGLPVFVASVVHSIEPSLSGLLTNRMIRWVSPKMDLGINLEAIDTSTIGADRLANAVAAVNELSLPVIVIDCGTAITTEVIDRSGRLLGGVIMPGRRLAADALRDGTDQLPRIELVDDAPTAIGNDTITAISLGINLGLLGAVEKVIASTEAQLNMPELSAVAVGGDQYYFSEHLDSVKPGPENFTLRGLAWIAKRNL